MTTIYVIFHVTFENATEKYEDTVGEWRWRKIVEGEEFEAEMNNIPLFSEKVLLPK